MRTIKLLVIGPGNWWFSEHKFTNDWTFVFVSLCMDLELHGATLTFDPRCHRSDSLTFALHAWCGCCRLTFSSSVLVRVKSSQLAKSHIKRAGKHEGGCCPCLSWLCVFCAHIYIYIFFPTLCSVIPACVGALSCWSHTRLCIDKGAVCRIVHTDGVIQEKTFSCLFLIGFFFLFFGLKKHFF